MKTIKTIATALIILVGIDMFGAVSWMMSGQKTPEGWFYLGSVTTHVVRAIADTHIQKFI